MMDGAVAYASTDAYRQTQRFLLDFYDRATGASPTITHRWLGQLAQSGRLLRLYTTNIDDLESQVPSLQVPQLTTQKRGQGADRELWTVNDNDAGPRTIQLHGRVTHMRCRRCGVLAATRPSLFREPPSPNGSVGNALDYPPGHDDCRPRNAQAGGYTLRTIQPRGFWRLDPVMYNDPDGHPLGSSIGRAVDRDAASMPDALLIIGSSLPSQIRALQNMAARMAGLIPDDKVIAWINPVAPPNIAIGQGRPCFFGIPLAADDVACSASAVSMPGPSPPPQTPFVSRPVHEVADKEHFIAWLRYLSQPADDSAAPDHPYVYQEVLMFRDRKDKDQWKHVYFGFPTMTLSKVSTLWRGGKDAAFGLVNLPSPERFVGIPGPPGGQGPNRYTANTTHLMAFGLIRNAYNSGVTVLLFDCDQDPMPMDKVQQGLRRRDVAPPLVQGLLSVIDAKVQQVEF
jgi:NAD-dependent histone deacetylase SIR2